MLFYVILAKTLQDAAGLIAQKEKQHHGEFEGLGMVT